MLRRYYTTIYALQKKYGVAGVLYKPTETEDRQTGQVTRTTSSVSIKRIVWLPDSIKFNQNQHHFEIGDIRVLVATLDVGTSYSWSLEDYFIIDSQRYNIVEYFPTAMGAAVYCHLRHSNE